MPNFGMNAAVSATEIPLAVIRQLKAQRMTNNQIIQTLQQQGYGTTQIFDALSQSSVQPSATLQSTQGLNTQGGMHQRMDQYMPQPTGIYQPPRQAEGSDTEEMIEAIIDEKWNDLLADINKVVAWKEATESRMIKIEQQLIDIRESFDKLQQAVVGKVGEYDRHILEVGVEVKAMEKVFSKVLPVFTDNVAELSRVADQMRKSAPVKK